MRYYCKCGLYFGKAQWRNEHVGLCNPHWPRKSDDDKHAPATEEQWRAKRAEGYRILRGE